MLKGTSSHSALYIRNGNDFVPVPVVDGTAEIGMRQSNFPVINAKQDEIKATRVLNRSDRTVHLTKK